MLDDDKARLHDQLRWSREALLWKLDGLDEYDVRRPLTPTGTSLLGLVKHVACSAARYLGEVFDRPFPDSVPRWDEPGAWEGEHAARADERREDVVALYRRVWAHADATIDALDFDAPGHVPWWPRPNVRLFDVLLHELDELSRHAGHADVLRELLDGAVGQHPSLAPETEDDAARAGRLAALELAAQEAAREAAGDGP